MDTDGQNTSAFYVSPERSSKAEIKLEHEKIISQKLFTDTLDTLSDILMIINQNRQVIYLNKAIFKILGSVNPDSLYGLKYGEMFHCKHFASAPGGCGTSEYCKLSYPYHGLYQAFRT